MQLCIEFQRSFFRDIDLVTKNVEFELKRNNVLSKWDVGNNDLAYLKKCLSFSQRTAKKIHACLEVKNETDYYV